MGLEGDEAGLSVPDVGKILDGHVQDKAEVGVTQSLVNYCSALWNVGAWEAGLQ